MLVLCVRFACWQLTMTARVDKMSDGVYSEKKWWLYLEEKRNTEHSRKVAVNQAHFNTKKMQQLAALPIDLAQVIFSNLSIDLSAHVPHILLHFHVKHKPQLFCKHVIQLLFGKKNNSKPELLYPHVIIDEQWIEYFLPYIPVQIVSLEFANVDKLRYQLYRYPLEQSNYVQYLLQTHRPNLQKLITIPWCTAPDAEKQTIPVHDKVTHLSTMGGIPIDQIIQYFPNVKHLNMQYVIYKDTLKNLPACQTLGLSYVADINNYLQKHGATIQNFAYAGAFDSSVKLPNVRILRGCEQYPMFSSIVELEFREVKFKHLNALPLLKKLIVENLIFSKKKINSIHSNIEYLKHRAAICNEQDLQQFCTHLTGLKQFRMKYYGKYSLKALASLHKLQSLSITCTTERFFDTRFDIKNYEPLALITTLTELKLVDCRTATLVQLVDLITSNLSHLQSLSLKKCRIKSLIRTIVLQLPHLTRLNLKQSTIDAHVLFASLQQNKKLQFVNLLSTKVGDDIFLECIHDACHLQQLIVDRYASVDMWKAFHKHVNVLQYYYARGVEFSQKFAPILLAE